MEGLKEYHQQGAHYSTHTVAVDHIFECCCVLYKERGGDGLCELCGALQGSKKKKKNTDMG